MYRKTFEVLAKYISKKTGVAIQFDTDGGAHADMKNDILHLPKDIAKSHAYAAISLIMHEAAHIRHSKVIPIDKVIKTKGEFSILNAIEDIRIDNLNFRVLPNVWNFYEALIDEVKKEFDPKTPLASRALCWCILKLENFNPKAMFGVDARALGMKCMEPIQDALYRIDVGHWDDLRNRILEIKKILGITAKQDPPMPQVQVAGLQMGGNVEGSPIDTDTTLHPGKVLSCGQGQGMDGGSSSAIGGLAMDEQCANQFKEILNVKERKVVDNGTYLDTDNLVAFKTGDVNALFKEEKIIKKKKSKIFFLMDASGSMSSPMLCGKSRSHVVSKAVKKMTDILDEVSSVEGLNVDWDVGAFRGSYVPLNKETWQQEYGSGGGTNFERPFLQVMDTMLKDYTIDGKRIIVCFTDGDVYDHEIDTVKASIMRNFTDVRALVISVGSTNNSRIVKEITGDNIIVAEDNAVPVIMETIKAML